MAKRRSPSRARTKRAPDVQIATLGGTPPKFGSPFTAGRPSATDLVKRYGMWVHRCVTLNSQTAAAVPYKLFTNDTGGRLKDWATVKGSWIRRPSKQVKDFLSGRGAMKPSASVQRALRGDADDVVEIERHPVLTVLGDVNEWTDGYAWRESLYADLQLFGRSFHRLVAAGPEDAPAEIWRVMPQKMKVIPDERDFVARFEYGTEPNLMRYTPAEVLWFRLFDPFDPWGGMGPLEAWLRTVDAAHAIQGFQYWLMDRGGAPDYVVKTGRPMDDPQRRAFRQEWRKLFGNMGHREETLAFLAGDESEIMRLGDSPKELEFGASEDRKRDQIGQAFGVPKSLLTSDDVNRANARESKQVYIETTIWPMVQRVEDIINERLLPRFTEGGGRLFIAHENPVPEDQEQMIADRASKLSSGWSVNEIRMDSGAEPLDDPAAEVPLIQATIGPLSAFAPRDGEAEEAPPAQRPLLDAPQIVAATAIVEAAAAGRIPLEAARGQLIVMFGLTTAQVDQMLAGVDTFEPPMPEPVPGAALPAAPPEEKRLLPPAPPAPPAVVNVAVNVADREKRVEHVRQLIEAEQSASNEWLWGRKDVRGEPSQLGEFGIENAAFAIALEKAMRGHAKLLIRIIGGLAIAEDIKNALTDEMVVEWSAEVQQIVHENLSKILAAQGAEQFRAAIGMVKKPPKGTVEVGFQMTNRRVQEYLANESRIIGRAATDRHRTALREALIAGTDAGENVAQITQRILSVSDQFTPVTAERIARTETAFAHMRGTMEGWAQSGVVTGKQFLLAPDACEWCKAVAAKFGDGKAGSENRTLGIFDAFFEPNSVLTAEFEQKDGTKVIRQMRMDYEGYAETGVIGPPIHPQCLLPDTEVAARDVVTAMRASYNGPAVRVCLASGRSLAVTPNHQFLTTNGFVAAQSLREGDDLISSCVGDSGEFAIAPDGYDRPTSIKNVARSFAVSGGVAAVSVPVAAEYLHGDARRCNGNIRVVSSDRLLRRATESAFFQQLQNLPLCAGWSRGRLACLGDVDSLLVTLSLTAHGVMGGGRKPQTFSRARLSHAHEHGIASTTLLEPDLGEVVGDSAATTSQRLGQLLDRFAGLVTMDHVVDVEWFDYSGHVYDLQTASGLYVASGTIVSNCRCDLVPVVSEEFR